MLLDRVPLLCPVCRQGGLRPAPDGRSLVCPEAGCCHPIVDGVPIVVEDWLGYARSERWMILRRRDLPGWMESMLDAPLGDGQAESIRASRLESYRRSHYQAPPAELATLAGALPAFVERVLAEHAPRDSRLALDAGCATGGHTQMLARYTECAVGIDFHFERVRLALELAPADARTVFLVANAETPPFEPGCFDVVLALNLIDSIARPRVALAGLNQCLRSGGLLVLTTPFHWSSVCTEPAEWLSETELGSALEAGYDLLCEQPRLPWVLPLGSRHADIFFVRAWALRKRLECGSLI